MDLGSTNGTFINVSSSYLYYLSACFSEFYKRLILLFVYHFLLTISLVFQDNRIEPQRYYELFEKDTIRFGNSRYAIKCHPQYGL